MEPITRIPSTPRPDSARRVLPVLMGVMVIAFVCVTAFMAGYALRWWQDEGAHPVGDVPTAQQERIKLFWEAWHLIEEHFYYTEPLDYDAMVQGATAGMVETLGDDHTAWLDPQTARLMSEDLSGTFEGIGATVDMVDNRLTIVRPLAGSPAERAGLRAGDVIVAVDGRPLGKTTLVEAIMLIRGPAGSTVRLQVQRPKDGRLEEFELEVRRERITLPTVESKILSGGVGYIRLTEFNSLAAGEVQKALRELNRQGMKGLVLDLRDNPGGYLDAAVEIADEFLEEGLIVTERDREGEGNDYSARRGGLATEIPLVVLVNGASASASEIVAGAIQDQGRGTLIGEQTFGKGSVQMTFALRDGSSLQVTVARWFTPSGRLIDGEGLMPDIVVPLTAEDSDAGRDPQLARALEFLVGP